MKRFLIPLILVLTMAGGLASMARAVAYPAAAGAPQQAAIAPAAQENPTPTPTITPTPVPLGERTVPETIEAVATPGGELVRDLSVELVKVADGLDDPVNVVSANDGSGRLFIVERPGRVRIVDADGELLEEPFLDLTTGLPSLNGVLDAFLEQGLYDIEFHPDFAENGRFFVHFASVMRNGDSMIVEYQVGDDPNVADPETAMAVLQIPQPWANHNGGELAFGPDGYLYIGSGDGGWEGDPLETGQYLGDLLGAILRIDVDTPDSDKAYSIPEDNPFRQDLNVIQLFGVTEEEFSQIHTEAAPEQLHYGLRNPWKFHFDPATGDLFLPDVGQNEWEEINFWPADGEAGQNFGWDFNMGTHCFPIQQEECPTVGVLPIAEYDHDTGITVIGLGVYRGPDYPHLDGVYFAADWGTGLIWGLAPDADDSWQMEELLDTSLNVTAGGNDEDGSLYVTTCDCAYGQQERQPGSLWRLVPTNAVPEDAETAPTG